MSEEITKRHTKRSECGTYDYVLEGTETICLMLVPTPETREYSRRLREIVMLPDLIAELKGSQ